MIKADGHIFVLETAHTTYCFRRMETGHLEHLYYGRCLTLPEHPAECDVAPLVEKHTFAPGNTNLCDGEHPAFSLEDMRLEMSSYGKGDIREPFVEIVHADGSTTSDFRYESYEITEKTAETENGDLPGAYDERGEAQRLCIRLRDHSYDLVLELHYDVYAECDAIVRSAVLFNESKEMIRLNRLMSTQIDFDPAEYVFTTFTGAWAREMRRSDTRMEAGKHVNASYTGTSSSRANPFVMIAKTDTTEDTGECYGCNLIYSGNHYEAAEVSGYGKMRLTAGINPQSFSWLLAPWENFAAPEAVMAYSCEGYNGMSQCMHAFVREHIVRGAFKHKVRPVLLNSWEAAYFDINERKLLALAKKAKEAGVELFVMDDGWFGDKYPRNNGETSLGDWTVCREKLPQGIEGLTESARKHGVKFGIWIEPEMTNTRSELYEKHPDWVIQQPYRENRKGRGGTQQVLDLSNPAVQEFVFGVVDRLMTAHPDIAYIKWDDNMTLYNYGSTFLPADRQSHLYIEYHRGMDKVLRRIQEKYPRLVMQSCASGGGRVNYGVLPYYDEFWTSDNTDALQRIYMQWGVSNFYPAVAMASHVSASPNHQTGRNVPLKLRFDVAMSGRLGLELQPSKMTGKEKEFARRAIADYKEIRPIVQQGDLYRLISPYDKTGYASLMYVAPEKDRAVWFVYKLEHFLNMPSPAFRMAGLDPGKRYRITELNVDGKPVPQDGKTFSGAFLMENGLEFTVGKEYASRVLELKAVE